MSDSWLPDNGSDHVYEPEESWMPDIQSSGADGPMSSDPMDVDPLDPAPSPEGTTDPAPEPKGFDPRSQSDFDGLMFIGALTSDFTWGGHRFRVKTLTVDEILEVGMVSRRYRDSVGESRAFLTAWVAASIVSVDGRPIHQPLGPEDGVQSMETKFKFVRDYWYAWTVDAIYNECLLLEERVVALINKMGEASS